MLWRMLRISSTKMMVPILSNTCRAKIRNSGGQPMLSDTMSRRRRNTAAVRVPMTPASAIMPSWTISQTEVNSLPNVFKASEMPAVNCWKSSMANTPCAKST